MEETMYTADRYALVLIAIAFSGIVAITVLDYLNTVIITTIRRGGIF